MREYRAGLSQFIQSNRGQCFIKSLAQYLDAMEEKALYLQADGGVHVIALIAKNNGAEVCDFYNNGDLDSKRFAKHFNISTYLVIELLYLNDAFFYHYIELCENSKEDAASCVWQAIREWVLANLKETK